MVDIIPSLPLEEFELPEDSEPEVVDESGGSVTYGFIGAGQAGGRIVEAFHGLDYKKAICINTAEADLNTVNIPNEQKIYLDVGPGGVGKIMEKGENAAQKYQQEIYDKMSKIFGEDIDRIIICAGLGGGTGGGSVLVLLDLARKYLAYVGCDDPKSHVGAIVTLPTAGEAASPKVAENATFAATRLAEIAENGDISPLIFVDNDKIKRLYPKLTVKAFWPTVNQTIAGLFHTFNIITTQDSEYTTFDATDYNSLMSTGGCAIMGLTTVKNFESETSVSKALKSNLSRTLLADGFDLSTAKGAACVVIGGEVLFEEVAGLQTAIDYGFDTIAQLTGNSTVHRGIYEAQHDKLVAYTLITGLASPKERIKKIKHLQANKGQSSFYTK
tara:strand:+ start:3293 stop:4450 length:1158 start_codon:yes stop_codon:yes gene_type:complete